MVAACLSVFMGAFAVYNFIFLARVLPDFEMELAVTPLCVSFNIFWCLAVWCYLRTHYTHPGGITERWRQYVYNNKLVVLPACQEWQPWQATLCYRCMDIRPQRTHHCTTTDTCVVRMDHYCPWTANCIGFRNHKFFLLLAFYSLCMVLIFLLSTAPLVVVIVINWLRGHSLRIWPCISMLAFDTLSCSLVYILGQMNYNHVLRALQNVTSIEEKYDNMPNPFDLHNWVENVSSIFGSFGPDWFLPVMPLRPRSDGIWFMRPFSELDSNLEMKIEFGMKGSLDTELLWNTCYHPSLTRTVGSYQPYQAFARLTNVRELHVSYDTDGETSATED